MIEALHGGEVRRLEASPSAGRCGARASASRPSSESASADAYASHGLLLIGGVAGAPAKRPAELLSQSLRSVGAEIDDGFAFYILAGVIVVLGERRVEAVAQEFDLINGDAAFAADVPLKSNALAVLEHSRLAVHFNRERRTILAFDAEHAHAMKVRAVVAARLDAPRPQLLGQVSGGQSQPFRESGAPFEFVRSQIGEPLLQIIGLHSRFIGFAVLRGNDADNQAERDKQH